MNQTDFSNLRFDRPQWRIPGRLIWMGVLVAGYGLAWVIIPHSFMFWLTLPVLCALGWAASFGWRQAVRILVGWLNQIQNL